MLGAAGRRAQSSPPLPSGALRGLCAWLDGLPLSRPKRHLARDFSDGVMLAEIVKHFYPRLVDLHNYVPTCNTDQKLSNWSVLNRKVFHKLRLWVSETEIQKVVANTPGAIEPILLALREKVKDGAVQQAPPPTADPGPSSADANSPQAQLTTPAHTGLQGPTVPSGVKTLPSQRTPERTGHFRTQPMGPWSTWIPGCNSYWRKRSRPWSCCRRWSRWTGCCLPDMCVLLKILQMKVVRLECLLKLKEQQIGELTRTGTSPSDREWPRRKSPLRGPGPTPPKATRP